MSKRIIYTSITGQYDSLKDPSIVSSDWEYICYTNNRSLKSKIWNIIYDENLNSVKKVREIKINTPFEYDECIWVDGSIKIQCSLNQFVNKYCMKDFTLMKHPHRGCVYEEGRACIKRRKDGEDIINQQLSFYSSQNYPINAGLVATGLMYRKNTKEIKDFCIEWNNQVQQYSVRDQLSFNYVSAKIGLDYHTIPFAILEKEFLLLRHNK